jgi:hypothetical protein
MYAESLIFRKLTTNEFKAITNTINSEGGGSQTYIDFPKGSISDASFKEFFGNEGTPNANGFEWVFYVNSLSLGRTHQKETISARRDTSNSLREQNNENRIEIWKNERSGFPADVYDDKNNPILVFIIKSVDKEYWAGWFYRNECNDTWPMTKGLSSMFWKDCAYIKFDSPIPFDTHDFKWPFLKTDALRIKELKMKNYSLQQIYYGAPGTGKSFKTNEVVEWYPETIRTTFHPDSDYSTFVGAYKPTNTTEEKYGLDSVGNTVAIGIEKDSSDTVIPIKEKKIEYKFVKQAFLKAYIKAWNLFKDSCIDGQEMSPQFLVIEEINRGNCAQIFGDLFQLLDRKNGFSEYPIEADEDIQKALLEDKPEDGLSFGEKGLQFTPEQIIYINAQFDKDGQPSQKVAEKISLGQVLVLPPNFYIWATMNTSDQSLFPIDSAFKRRWDWKYVRICEGKKKDGTPLDYRIKFTIPANDGKPEEVVDEKWWEFVKAINTKIEEATKSEDKKLGFFFCKPDKKAADADECNTIISAETFVGKVVFYLWQDVFKDYGFKSDIFKKDDKKISFHDFYPEDIVADETSNPEGIDLALVKTFIYKVIGKKENETPEATAEA